jgi:diguanylate cyclase (GGDEF)-like protein
MVKNLKSGETARARLYIYRLFDSLPFLEGRYARKFAAVTLVAAVPPLATILLFLAFSQDGGSTRTQLLPALGLTYLAGFMATLWLHRGLLAPVELSASTVKEFLDEHRAPDLPGDFRDDAGRLMGRTQYLLNLFQRWGVRLERLSDLDEVTGVYNRGAGEKRLSEEIARAERDLETFHLGLVDIRGFRALCEEHGYEGGDFALVHLVGTLIVNTRRGDWIAKWGTNQFLVGLHRNRNARLVIDRIMEGIESVPCEVSPGREITMRVSCAMVEYPFGAGLKGAVEILEDALMESKLRALPEGPSIGTLIPLARIAAPADVG